MVGLVDTWATGGAPSATHLAAIDRHLKRREGFFDRRHIDISSSEYQWRCRRMLEGYQRDLVLKHVEIQDSTETQNAGFPWRNGRGGKPRASGAGRAQQNSYVSGRT